MRSIELTDAEAGYVELLLRTEKSRLWQVSQTEDLNPEVRARSLGKARWVNDLRAKFLGSSAPASPGRNATRARPRSRQQVATG